MKTTGYGQIIDLKARSGVIKVLNDRQLASERVDKLFFTLPSIQADSDLRGDDLTDVFGLNDYVEYISERAGRHTAPWTTTRLAVLESASYDAGRQPLLVAGVISRYGKDKNNQPYGHFVSKVTEGKASYDVPVCIYEEAFVFPPNMPCGMSMLHLFAQGQCLVLCKVVAQERTHFKHRRFKAISCRLADLPRPRPLISPKRSSAGGAAGGGGGGGVAGVGGSRRAEERTREETACRFIPDAWDFLTGQPAAASGGAQRLSKSASASAVVDASTTPTTSAGAAAKHSCHELAAAIKGAAKLYPKGFRSISTQKHSVLESEAAFLLRELLPALDYTETTELYARCGELISFLDNLM